MRLHLALFAAAFFATCDAVPAAGPSELSNMASPASALSTNAAQNAGRFLRTSKTDDDDDSDDLYDDLYDDESDDNSNDLYDDDEEERTFDVMIAKWRNIFDDYYRMGTKVDDVADDLGATYYINKYGHNLGKLSKKEAYQKWVAYKAYLEKIRNNEIPAPK
ncbi:hypothetical protein PHYBOEH_009811 [Phytophthora boehmeriae]|uniref:RxLR effector protein n=1 Tax=Phytophthora boehmeriae TaxID=109152 RepID=A0A8T1VU07_9STRA|nr:hypothetical protein PHYBOEH_009811 [Phytophthora boehmeriae]